MIDLTPSRRALAAVLLLCGLSLLAFAAEPRGDSSVSLRDYVDARFDALATATKLDYQVVEARLEVLNQAREQRSDEAKMFATKSELESLKEQVTSLRESRAMMEGKASANSVLFTGGIAVLSLGLNIVGFMRNRRPQC